MDDGFLPVYDIHEPLADGYRLIGDAQGIEAAERACEVLLAEGECGRVQLWLGDRIVADAELDRGTGDVRWRTYGRRKDLR